jgi:hypothetical protein
MAGHAARMTEKTTAYKILAGKCEGKRLFGRRKSRWENNIKIYLRTTLREGMNWIKLAQDRNRW